MVGHSFRKRIFSVSHLQLHLQPNLINQETEHKETQNNSTQKAALANMTKLSQKNPRLRQRTEESLVSRLLRHLARKLTTSILSTWSPQGARVPKPVGARGRDESS